MVAILQGIYSTGHFLHTLYLFTANDFLTFAVPTILFGFCGALSGPVLSTNESPSVSAILQRIPVTLVMIWINRVYSLPTHF